MSQQSEIQENKMEGEEPESTVLKVSKQNSFVMCFLKSMSLKTLNLTQKIIKEKIKSG